jgi:hypothetical protein
MYPDASRAGVMSRQMHPLYLFGGRGNVATVCVKYSPSQKHFHVITLAVKINNFFSSAKRRQHFSNIT